QLPGRPRIGRRLEHDQLSLAQRAPYRFGGRERVAYVGIFGLGKRRRYADRDDVRLVETREVGGGSEPLGLDGVGNGAGRPVLNVGAAAVQRIDDALIHVKSQHAVAGAHGFHRERQADVAKAHDPKDGGAVFGFRQEIIDCGRDSSSCGHGTSGAPPRASEREAASNTRTTRTPSSAVARGGSRPCAARTKCASSAASGSTAGRRGMKMSPSRIARLSPNEPYSGGRSTPLS